MHNGLVRITHFLHRNVGLILAKMRGNVALRYGFSQFRQATSGIPWENFRYVRLETDFISKEICQVLFSTGATKWSYFSSKPHVEMLKVNDVLSTPSAIFSDGLFQSFSAGLFQSLFQSLSRRFVWSQGRRRRGGGSPDPRTFENRVGRPPPPPQIRE